MKSPITTHVLDTARGCPAADIEVILESANADGFQSLSEGRTDADGRVGDLLPSDHSLQAGVYRLTFRVGPYFKAQDITAFYPEVAILFQVENQEDHYHVPLLLSPFGYSTYRGS